MSMLHPHAPPKGGWAGLLQNWRNDVLAAFAVSMVALPLSLGIAVASGVPPIAGLFSALIAGLVTTFVRGSHIAINGPGNGLIAVVLVAMTSLDDGSGHAFQYVLAATVVAGGLQIVIGLLRLGKLGELFPSSVIYGILAAIGVIILGKQVHVALGATTSASSTLGVLLDIPSSVFRLNPAVTLIALLSLVILVVYPRLQNKLIHLVPAPMWVLLIAIPLALVFGFSESWSYELLGRGHELGPNLLVQIPDSLFASFLLPDFSLWSDPAFWGVVFSITLISSIETLISVKAIDQLDPYKRATDANHELIGVGASSLLAGLIGGLPVVTVIARSSVNVLNHAKTAWSNFFSGGFLFIFVVLCAPIIQRVPLAALAAILVYTGYKLAAPKVFKDALLRGWEQLLFVLVTLVATLLTNLVGGLVIGTVFTLLFHLVRTGISPPTFFRALFKPSFRLDESDGVQVVRIGGIASFANILKLRRVFEGLRSGGRVRADFSDALLVDLTVLEYIHDLADAHRHEGGQFEFLGLERMQASSSYPQSMRAGLAPAVALTAPEAPLSRRQQELKRLAETHGWSYQRELDWDASYLKNFQFFETRPLEYKENVLSGEYDPFGVRWEIADLTFDEGALMADEFHTTVQVLFPSRPLPEFVLEQTESFDRLMRLLGHKDIDFQFFTHFSPKFVVKGERRAELEELFTPERIRFFETHDLYHLESNGEALLVFRRFRLERPQGILEMYGFTRELLELLEGQAVSAS